MLATLSLVFGILLAVVVLAVTRRPKAQGSGPALQLTPLGWSTLGFGLSAVTALLLGLWLTPNRGALGEAALWLLNLSIALAVAAVAAGVGAYMQHDRRWQIWAGLAAGLVAAIFWVTFAAGSIFGLGG